MTTADVLAEVRRRGMSEQDFRGEMRRQVPEGKLIGARHDADAAGAHPGLRRGERTK